MTSSAAIGRTRHSPKQAATTRNTTTRDRHRAIIARDQPPCWLCGGEIDYTLPHGQPGSYEVDHVIPLAKGGPDTIDNKRASHRACNRDKSDSMPADYQAQTEQPTATTTLLEW